MAETRTPRDLTSRDKKARAVYVPPSTLPTPNPEPGIAFRWIATSVMGEAQHTNVSNKMREGWEPVKASEYPELMLKGNSDGNVEIGGLMLCRMPEEQAKARDEYYEAQNRAQMDSVDNNFMRNNDPRMPLFSERDSRTSRGGGFGNGTR